jgi:hypothetical protein
MMLSCTHFHLDATIDVEAIRVIRDADDIAARFFTAAGMSRTSPSIRATNRWDSSIAGRER